MPSKKQQSELPLPSPLLQGALDTAAPSARNAPELGSTKLETDVSFEAAIERLSQIVEALESAGLPLEESLKLFEEGVQLARKSQARLDNAERKVQELLAYDEGGKPIVEEFDPE